MIAGVDPATASGVWTSPIYTTGAIKVSSTLTSHLLVEGGFSTEHRALHHPDRSPASRKHRGTPAWYYGNPEDTIRRSGTYWNFSYGGENYGRFPDRYAVAGSVSYITGTHNVKVGLQDTWGTLSPHGHRQRRHPCHLRERRRDDRARS